MKRQTVSTLIILILLVQLPVDGITVNDNSAGTGSDISIPDNDSGDPGDQPGLVSNRGIFTANLGQIRSSDIKYYVQGGGLWFTSTGMWITKTEVPETSIQYKSPTECLIKHEFVGGNKVQPEGRQRLGHYNNYFYGSDPVLWRSHAPNYREVFYKDIYPGIDLRYYNPGGGLKYDLIVNPGADFEQIRMRYSGIDRLSVDEKGDLIIRTGVGSFSDGGLYMYQETENGRSPVRGNFVLFSDNEYGFELREDFDRTKAIVIDPFMEFSSFLGGNQKDRIEDMALDFLGNVLVTGYTWSSDYPVSNGGYSEIPYGSSDAFISKLNHNGSILYYSTFIGGISEDHARGIDTDSQGNAYITGYTDSFNFPVTTNVDYKAEFDAFVLRLNIDGSKLLNSTLIGGTVDDYSTDIVFHSTGYVYVTGYTFSTVFPTTPGAYKTSHSGSCDVFVLKLPVSNFEPVFSTLIGGADQDYGYAITADSTGNVYITGSTTSPAFPTSPLAKYKTKSAGEDVFVLKLKSDGSGILSSTFAGGGGTEKGNSITLDSANNIYVTGMVESSDFPVPASPDPYNMNHSGGSDAFVLKFNNDCSELLYSTFIGGTKSDTAQSIKVDKQGNIYLTGSTESSNFATTQNATDHSHNGKTDVFIMKLNADGKTLLYSTLVGGPGDETALTMVLDSANGIYTAGYSSSKDFPVTGSPYQDTYDGNEDAFVTKISFDDYMVLTSLGLALETSKTNLVHPIDVPYTFTVKVENTYSLSDLVEVKLGLKFNADTIWLRWDGILDTFTESSDTNDFVSLEPTSYAYNDQYSKWTVNFDVIFSWSYPAISFQDVDVTVYSNRFGTITETFKNFFRLENTLEFDGTLTGIGEDNRPIMDNSYVRPGEELNWTGLTVRFYGSAFLYPSIEGLTIKITDQESNSWSDQVGPGEMFEIQFTAPNQTSAEGMKYTIEMLNVPAGVETEKLEFLLHVDGDGVSFSEPFPTSTKSDLVVNVGITITDELNYVRGSSIEYSISYDGGNYWNDWESALIEENNQVIMVSLILEFNSGPGNRIKWRASDVLGNGPTESESYQVDIDLDYVPGFDFIIWSEPETVVLEPYEAKTVKIKVQNAGDGVDKIRITTTPEPATDITIEHLGNKTRILERDKTVVFTINISAGKNTPKSSKVMIKVLSLNSIDFGMEYNENYELIVEVPSASNGIPVKDNTPDDKKGMGTAQLFRLVLIIAVIILAVIIIGSYVFLARKKKALVAVKARAYKVEESKDVTIETKFPKSKQEKIIDLEETDKGVWDERKR